MTEAIREFLAAEQAKGYPMVLIDDVLALLAPAGRLTDTTDPTEPSLSDRVGMLAAWLMNEQGHSSEDAAMLYAAQAELERLAGRRTEAETKEQWAVSGGGWPFTTATTERSARNILADGLAGGAGPDRHVVVRTVSPWRAASLLAQPETPVAHNYLSTACLHGEHGVCQTDATRYDGTHKAPAQCKFCAAPCRCDCHGPALVLPEESTPE